MGRNEFANLGDEIKDAVQSAINKGDFAKLRAEIGDSVNQAFDEIKQSLQGTWSDSNVKQPGSKQNENQERQSGQAGQNGQAAQNYRREPARQPGQAARQNQARRAYSQAARPAGTAGRRMSDQGRSGVARSGTEVERVSGTIVNARKSNLPALPVRPVGKVGGILFTIFGSILLGLGLLGLMLFTSLGLVTGGGDSLYFLAIFLGLPTAAAGALMLSAGRLKARRLSRMNHYVKLIGTKGYCDIKELALKSGRSVRYMIKDLRRMIRLGMFPEGHLDDKKTCFMLDNKTHQLYLEMMQAQGKVQEEAPSQEEKPEETEEDAKQAAARKVVEEGNAYIQQIRQANAAIRGEEISAKLDRLSMIMDKIFLHIERHPEEVEELHRFMEYYLPTTLKLVNAYQEFDAQPVQGANITTAKREIEETLDTINQAFERLFDNFYADAAMDISTDIDVLETMLAQEGLTGHSFEEKKEA